MVVSLYFLLDRKYRNNQGHTFSNNIWRSHIFQTLINLVKFFGLAFLNFCYLTDYNGLKRYQSTQISTFRAMLNSHRVHAPVDTGGFSGGVRTPPTSFVHPPPPPPPPTCFAPPPPPTFTCTPPTFLLLIPETIV